MNLELGKILFTAAIADAVSNSNDFSAFVCQSIQKHKSYNFGDCEPEDITSNQRALSSEGRIFSVYTTPSVLEVNEPKIWIIIEWDRNVTTVLLLRDYQLVVSASANYYIGFALCTNSIIFGHKLKHFLVKCSNYFDDIQS